VNRANRQRYSAVLEELRTHQRRESEVLDSYRQLAEGSSDEGVRYIAQLIVDDEGRHHQMIEEMANRVESWIDGVEVEPSTPALNPRVDPPLLAETRRLIALERDDARELRRLEKDLHDVPAASLLPLLVKLMHHDTARHIEMLRFIRTYTG
jgi:rubrerythrin